MKILFLSILKSEVYICLYLQIHVFHFLFVEDLPLILQ